MDPSVDWNAFKVWGSVSLVALVVLIGGLIWCWCRCYRCCCDRCGCCSSGNCADDCHCSCCSRVKKENVTRATSNEGLELGGPANGGNNQFEDVINTVSGQVHHHSLTTGQPKCSLSFEDETNDRRVSFEPAVAPRYDQEPESPDDVTPDEKDSVRSHNIHKEINDGHDNKGYEADDGGDDDDDDDNIHHPGDRPTSDIGTSYRNQSDTIIPVDVDGYNSRDDSKSSIGSDVGGQQARLQAIKDCVDDENTKDSEERNHKSTAGVGLDDIKSNFTFANLNAILGQWFPSHNDDVDNSTRQYIDDSEGNSIESSSSSEEEIDGFVVGEKLMERHVVMAREIPLDMSTEKKEDFAYRKARMLYRNIPSKYTLIRVYNINDFRRKVLKDAIQKAVGLNQFTTTERFDVVHFRKDDDTGYIFDCAGQARLKLNCNPEKVVSHLAGVVFS